jgi:hypothetical protein
MLISRKEVEDRAGQACAALQKESRIEMLCCQTGEASDCIVLI